MKIPTGTCFSANPRPQYLVNYLIKNMDKVAEKTTIRDDIKNTGSWTVIWSNKYLNRCPKCGKLVSMELYGDDKREMFIATCKDCDVLFVGALTP